MSMGCIEMPHKRGNLQSRVYEYCCITANHMSAEADAASTEPHVRIHANIQVRMPSPTLLYAHIVYMSKAWPSTKSVTLVPPRWVRL